MTEGDDRIIELVAQAVEAGQGDELIRRLVAQEAGSEAADDTEALRAAVRLLRDISGLVSRAASGDADAEKALEQVREALARGGLT